MHVYAPGASRYRVVSLRVAPQPHLRLLPLAYPASEIYHFKPLDDRVPVYQKPFALLQEIVIEGDPAAQAALKGREALTLSGSLEYQACDDELSFNPVSVPLSWTVPLQPPTIQFGLNPSKNSDSPAFHPRILPKVVGYPTIQTRASCQFRLQISRLKELYP